MCYKCGKKLDFYSPVSRSETCPSCGADIRCCKNCNHYSPSSHFGCKEHIDELVVEKERANFCDWFSFSMKRDSTVQKNVDAKNQFNSLFGD